MIRVIALNELRRRLRDRSVLIGCLAAPLLMSAVLGLSFAGGAAATSVHIGVSGASPQLMAAAVRASQLPAGVTVVADADDQVCQDRGGGRAARRRGRRLAWSAAPHSLLVPIVDPGATHTPGFDVVTRGTSQLGEEYAESVAAGFSSVLVRGDGCRTGRRRRPGHGHGHGDGRRDEQPDHRPAAVAITTQNVGHGGKVNLNFFAPNIAVVFLFIGSGLGMRSCSWSGPQARWPG